MVDLLGTITKDINEKVMIELGGHHGSSFSSILTRERWTVHTFEPDDVNRAHLDELYGENISRATRSRRPTPNCR